MPEESDHVGQLQARIDVLEELCRRVPLVWARCLHERSFCIQEPGTASYDFVNLVYKIEQTVPPEENPVSPL